MKTYISVSSEGFRPITVTLTFETESEANQFYHRLDMDMGALSAHVEENGDKVMSDGIDLCAPLLRSFSDAYTPEGHG